MSDTVERLARRWEKASLFTTKKFATLDEIHEGQARWWLLAIADELDAESSAISDRIGVKQGRHTHHMARTAGWLRTQASEGE